MFSAPNIYTYLCLATHKMNQITIQYDYMIIAWVWASPASDRMGIPLAIPLWWLVSGF